MLATTCWKLTGRSKWLEVASGVLEGATGVKIHGVLNPDQGRQTYG